MSTIIHWDIINGLYENVLYEKRDIIRGLGCFWVHFLLFLSIFGKKNVLFWEIISPVDLIRESSEL